MEDTLFSSFDDYFKDRSKNVFEKMQNMSEPDSIEMLNIFQRSNELLNSFKKMKNPENFPEISIRFKNYFISNLNKGLPEIPKHYPCRYCTSQGVSSFYYTSPEILNLVWIQMKSSLVWYRQLLDDGYYI